MQSYEVRDMLADALIVDMVGPDVSRGLGIPDEELTQTPSKWYLTGFLVPIKAPEDQRGQILENDELDEPGDAKATDDNTVPEKRPGRISFFPSSVGLTTIVPKETRKLTIMARWGDYVRRELASEQVSDEEDTDADSTIDEHGQRTYWVWKRVPHEEILELDIPDRPLSPVRVPVTNSNGLFIEMSTRPISVYIKNEVPDGLKSVSVFLVNNRKPEPDHSKDITFAFQAQIELHSVVPFFSRPDLSEYHSEEWDSRVADLQYRDVYDYATGHGCAAEPVELVKGQCFRVRTCWVPRHAVERVAPSPIPGVELSMDNLAHLTDMTDVNTKLTALVTEYRLQLDAQEQTIGNLSKRRKEVAKELLERARYAAKRIEQGIAVLADPHCFEAFRLMNRAMADSARQRHGIMQNCDPSTIQPSWRPFQLAFILMNLPGIADPRHADRHCVDLLFFPTGGGKTEAYLGISAFTLLLRRLKHPTITSSGLSVLMRYTLRLLTLDQLGRAATLVCALELLRQANEVKLGAWPFEIGLWVGQSATPNRMGVKGDNNHESARAKTIAYKNNSKKPSPIPLEECPWCGRRFGPNSFQLSPSPDRPTDLRITCLNRDCRFGGRNGHLPILTVDEPIYRRLPCFIIATVDKFAALPWTGEVGKFFGRVQRYDKNGFYGPCEPGCGGRFPEGETLLPPDLIIQDELHLISGPLGTMVGLYESALDELCTRRSVDSDGNETKLTPKIIASTATVRRADSQIKALFNRSNVDVFPPPLIDRHNSFFAETIPAKEQARLYVGVAAQGRSPKVVMLRTYLVLLAAAQKAFRAEGGKRNPTNATDPYMTLLGYFGSLRELGGARRIIEDEVRSRLSSYFRRRRSNESEGWFVDRKIQAEPVELTSRISTADVAQAKQRLAFPFYENRNVDVAIATNMISVGLDIPRLGLMVVFGQPKTSAEYIQATSRVGRDKDKPGLVVTIMNIHRPRDRSHYESFIGYHQAFYRSVESASVTPFSPRALDRGLAGTLIGLIRHQFETLTPPKGAGEIIGQRGTLNASVKLLTERAAETVSDIDERTSVTERVHDMAVDILDNWTTYAYELREHQGLQYQSEVGGPQRLLFPFLDPELKNLPPRHKKFRANRSLRDVEASVNLVLRNFEDIEIEEEIDE